MAYKNTEIRGISTIFKFQMSATGTRRGAAHWCSIPERTAKFLPLSSLADSEDPETFVLSPFPDESSLYLNTSADGS